MTKFPERRTAPSAALIFSIAAALVFFLQGCGSSLQLTSKWSEHKIQIEGDLKEWSDSALFVQKDDIRCGVMNDNEFLYVCVISSKPNLGRQVMFRGMTVWFDPNGGEKKTLGIRFPIGMGGRDIMTRPEGDEGGQRGYRVEAMERQALNEFEYVGPTEMDLQRVSRLQGQGVEMHLTSTPERFVYQLRVPLAYSSAHPYAVESRPGAPIGVGFETNTPQRPGQPTGGGEGRGDGGRGGQPGMGGGRGGRIPGGAGPGGMRPEMSNVSFSIWTHVQLAEKPR
ncbi:MAG: hypothetical protein Q8P51_09755 [Ignavibacteria bacterium]|nr:hypothetical protein [Ignavibacteria bacterium]